MLSKIKYYLRIVRKEFFLGVKSLIADSIVELMMLGFFAGATALYLLLK